MPAKKKKSTKVTLILIINRELMVIVNVGGNGLGDIEFKFRTSQFVSSIVLILFGNNSPFING